MRLLVLLPGSSYKLENGLNFLQVVSNETLNLACCTFRLFDFDCLFDSIIEIMSGSRFRVNFLLI